MPRARCALAMTPHKGVRHKPGGRTEASAPTDGLLVVPCAAGHMGPALQGIFVGQGPCALPGVRRKPGRADVGIGPYGSATRGAMGGRPQGSPLRKRYKGCGEAGGVRAPRHTGSTRGAVKRADVGIGPYGV